MFKIIRKRLNLPSHLLQSKGSKGRNQDVLALQARGELRPSGALGRGRKGILLDARIVRRGNLLPPPLSPGAVFILLFQDLSGAYGAIHFMEFFPQFSQIVQGLSMCFGVRRVEQIDMQKGH